MTIEAARQGYAFAQVRPRADRDYQAAASTSIYTIDDGQRLYIEQINVRGNTRTRDYVIRREFDVAEGDPYNRALINRAERRLRNLGYFKEVKIATEPGSSPDRVIINVQVEEQSTGEFSIGGGYSTADGFLAEVSVGERNLLGHGLYAKASVQYGQYSSRLHAVVRRALSARLSPGARRRPVLAEFRSRPTSSPMRRERPAADCGSASRCARICRCSFAIRSSARRSTMPDYLRNCNNITSRTAPSAAFRHIRLTGICHGPAFIDPATGLPFTQNCFADGEASLAVRRELAEGPVLTSLVGYDLAYNTLDNNRNPTSGLLAVLKQDFAGVGGDVQYIRTTGDIRSYYEPIQDVIGVLRLQGGYIHGWGSDGLRMLDHFQMGPNLVRGFAPSGIGPRDLTLRQPAATRSAARSIGARASNSRRRCSSRPRRSASSCASLRTPARCGSMSARPSGFRRARGDRRDAHAVEQRHVREFVGGCRPALGVAVRTAALRSRLSDHKAVVSIAPRSSVSAAVQYSKPSGRSRHDRSCMSARSFFRSGKRLTVGEIAALTGAELRRKRRSGAADCRHCGARPRRDRRIWCSWTMPSSPARPRAAPRGACLTSERLARSCSGNTSHCWSLTSRSTRSSMWRARSFPLRCGRPRCFARRPASLPGASMHPSARLESGVTVDPGAVIGAGAEIGSGTMIGANAVIGREVRIGRDCVDRAECLDHSCAHR